VCVGGCVCVCVCVWVTAYLACFFVRFYVCCVDGRMGYWVGGWVGAGKTARGVTASPTTLEAESQTRASRSMLLPASILNFRDCVIHVVAAAGLRAGVQQHVGLW
jgi:hypothetical protein